VRPIEPVHADATLRLASAGNVLFAAWTGAPSVEQMRELGRVSRSFSDRHGGEAAFWDVVVSGRPSFDDGVRRESQALTSDHLFRLAVAHLVLPDGLTGAAIRAFLSTMILLGRPATPTKVFDDPRACASWFVPRLAAGGTPWTEAELLDVHQRFLDGRT
jgi:hypothetical protein